MTAKSDDVLEVIRQRRSIRAFTDAPVDREQLETILDAGRWAPSGLNNQPWRFVVVREGDERCSKLAKCTKYRNTVEGAKVLIVVLAHKNSMYNATKDYQGIGACIQNMLLAVHALGLGGVWLGEILNQESRVLKILGLDSDEYELMAVIAVGHPAERGASQRKPVHDLLLEEL
jgi:nitroreductase